VPRFQSDAVALCAVLAFVGWLSSAADLLRRRSGGRRHPPVPASNPDAHSLRNSHATTSTDAQVDVERSVGRQAARCRAPMACSGFGTPSRRCSLNPSEATARCRCRIILYYALAIVSVGLFSVSATTLWWMLHACTARKHGGHGFSAPNARARPGRSRWCCPPRHEQASSVTRSMRCRLITRTRGDRGHRSRRPETNTSRV